jgi:hypothetical protein
MKALLLSPKVWLWSFLILILSFIFLGPVQRVRDLAAVQGAVQRDWEISFGYSKGPDKPAFLPACLDSAAHDYIDRILGHTHGYDGSQPAKTRNRDIVYYDRFRSFFRGSIQDVHVYDFEEFHGDLGAALSRLRDLRRFTAWAEDSETLPTEAEWTLLCTHLRALPHLEEIEIGGWQITNRAIAPLAGHPRLRSLSIIAGRLSPSSTTTFATLPRLTKLHVGEQLHEGEAWFSAAQQAAITAALPHTEIEIDFR